MTTTTPNRRLLVIANLVHASPRLPGILVHLPEQGWEVDIVCPALPDKAKETLGFPPGFLDRVSIHETVDPGDIFRQWRKLFRAAGYNSKESLTEQLKVNFNVKTRRSWVDRAMSTYQFFFAYPDTEVPWKKLGYQKGAELLTKQPYSYILSSSPFPTVHLIANRLSKKFGVRWLADFRDTWTENPLYEFPWPRRAIEKRLETQTLRQATKISTVSEEYAQELRKMHKAPITVVPNGYSDHLYTQETVPTDQKFTLIYTGTIYDTKQDVSKPMQAVAGLIREGHLDAEKIEFHFYGRRNNSVRVAAEEAGIEKLVHQEGSVSRQASQAAQKSAQILLFLNWEDPGKKGLSHLKLYEYLAAGRPILATGGFHGTVNEAVIQDTESGTYATSIEEIKTALLAAYREFEETGSVSFSGKEERIQKHGYRERADSIVQLLGQN